MLASLKNTSALSEFLFGLSFSIIGRSLQRNVRVKAGFLTIFNAIGGFPSAATSFLKRVSVRIHKLGRVFI